MTKTIDVDLPVDIFGARVSIPLIHQVVTAQLAAARQGTHDVKTRAEVAGGGRKPWRQKGTGRARQGSIRAPQWTGGGVVHGPTPRSYEQRTPKKMKAAALRGALTDRARSGRIHVVDQLVTDAPSTKTAVAALRGITDRRRVLVVVEANDTATIKSLRNAVDIEMISHDQLNTHDVILSDDVVFIEGAFKAFVEARSVEGSETVKLSAAVTDEVPAAKPAAKKAPAKKSEPKAAAKTEASDEPKAFAAVPTEDASDEDDAKAAGATKTQPYGPGSKAPLASGNAPKGFDIKGNEDSMLYHTTASPWYETTVAEVWFNTVEAAEAAGFEPAGGAETQEEN